MISRYFYIDDIETLLDPAGKTQNLMLTYAVTD